MTDTISERWRVLSANVEKGDAGGRVLPAIYGDEIAKTS
jgi:hypothetical protein